ncbi:hypothetical protein [Kocuria palustris]|uniref:hypothetical protein n=1 Tax=Kocuria palustris TaxID=71999 RepID=UPI000A9DC77A|nr:hypothetical protein [Kocuria palustris]
MTQTIWNNLVVETQFATEMILVGLRRLSCVPTDPELVKWGSGNLNYALHVGMYSYSSGLERLCKLAIACNNYAETGEFPNLRRYSHNIGRLLSAVEELKPTGQGVSNCDSKYLTRPVDCLDPDLTRTVERFANGPGRYEHLDSLWNEGAEVNTYNEWSALAERASVPDQVHLLIAIRGMITNIFDSELSKVGLEETAIAMLGDLRNPIYEPSVGVVISLFRQVRWVSSILDNATYYTRQEIPILGEIVSPAFLQSSANFIADDIARIGDGDVALEELQESIKRAGSWGDEIEIDDVDEACHEE